MNVTRITSRVAALALAATALLATPALAGFPVSPHAVVWVDAWGAGTVTVCASGAVDDGAYVTGAWTFTAATATAGVPGVTVPDTRVGSTYARCTTLPAPANTLVLAGLGYGGIGSVDVAGGAGLVGHRTSATAPGAVLFSTSG